MAAGKTGLGRLTEWLIFGFRFLDLLYEDLRKDFMSPLQVGKERWESYKAGRLSEIRQLLRIDLLENKYEEALDYTLWKAIKKTESP